MSGRTLNLQSCGLRMSRELAAAAITAYQRHLSPRKGFCCAWRHRTGGLSCSEYARRMALRRGLPALWTAMPRQFSRCRMAHQAALAAAGRGLAPPEKREEKSSRRWEFCDLPCELLDMTQHCDGLSACDLPWDCSW